MQEDEPLERGFGQAAGAFFRGVLGERGVTIVGGDEVDRFEGEGRVEARRHQGRARARRAARRLRRRRHAGRDARQERRPGARATAAAIRCDAHLRTSADGVWAAGDVCEYAERRPRRGGSASSTPTTPGTRAPTRPRDARRRGALRRRALLLQRPRRLAVAGVRRPGARLGRGGRRRLDGDGEFGVWYLKHGRVLGALSVGGGIDLDRARELLRGRQQVEPDSLR